MLRTASGHLARNAVAYLALFVALGGTSVAAVSLKRGSVKGRNIARNAVTGSKVKDGSLSAGDFGAGALRRGQDGQDGPVGAQGAKGAPCSAADPACRGPKGDTGQQGPGAKKIAFATDVAHGPTYNVLLAVVGPWTLTADCDPQGGTGIYLYLAGPGTVDYHVVRSTSDAGPFTTLAKTLPVTGSSMYDFGGYTPDAAYLRSAGTLILHSGTTVAQVELNMLSDRRPDPDTCAVYGTAIPAS